MIEIEINKDIRKYEAKLVGPLTTRQTICFSIGVVISIALYSAFGFLPQDIRFFVILLCVSPVLLCGWVKPYGIPFEKFVKTAFVSNVLSPKNRKYITSNVFAEAKEPEIKSSSTKSSKNGKKKGNQSKNKKKKNKK